MAQTKTKTTLSQSRPELAAQWHPTKNGGLTPEQVAAVSNKKVWWKCSEGPDHEWQTTIDSRTRRGHGCPMCSGRAASVTNCLSTLYPQIAREWHPTKNPGLTPDLVASGTHVRAWWICPEGPDHEWEAAIASRTYTGRGCPFCSGKRVSVTNAPK